MVRERGSSLTLSRGERRSSSWMRCPTWSRQRHQPTGCCGLDHSPEATQALGMRPWKLNKEQPLIAWKRRAKVDVPRDFWCSRRIFIDFMVWSDETRYPLTHSDYDLVHQWSWHWEAPRGERPGGKEAHVLAILIGKLWVRTWLQGDSWWSEGVNQMVFHKVLLDEPGPTILATTNSCPAATAQYF